MSDSNLAPWVRRPEPGTLADYCALAEVSAGTPAQIERTGSLDCPIASAVIESLRFELANTERLVECLQQELWKARGAADDE